jgi:ribose transport system substrate-binding protein
MKKLLVIMMLVVMIFSVVGCSAEGAEDSAKTVSIMTPYLSSVTTNEMAETMKAGMEEKGWVVNVIDTKGDVAQLASRMEDVVSAKTDAIVLVSTDPNLVQTQIEKAAEANIPVFGCDSSFIEGMTVNATSDNAAMSVTITQYLFDLMGGKGKLIVLTHRPHPGVLLRTTKLDELLIEYPEIEVITEQHVEVPGPIENSRKTMESLILANSEVDSITAVWCAWDEPAIGVSQALADAGRDEVFVIGIDGNSQAVEMINEGSNLKASIAQNFTGMADIVIEEMNKTFNNESVEKGNKYAPATLITK